MYFNKKPVTMHRFFKLRIISDLSFKPFLGFSRIFHFQFNFGQFRTRGLNFKTHQLITTECIHRKSTLLFRSEEHTSELQSRENIVCRLLLEKKNRALFAQSTKRV